MNPLRSLFLILLLTVSAVVANGQRSELHAALRQAAQNGDRQAVKELIAKGADVNAKDETGQSALFWVAPARDNPEMVKLLIAKGAEVNAKDNDGNTALMIAASQSNPGILKALIEAGAAVDSQNNSGETALMWAAYRANLEELRILLANSANCKLRDKKGRAASDFAREGSRNYTDEINEKRFAQAVELLDSARR